MIKTITTAVMLLVGVSAFGQDQYFLDYCERLGITLPKQKIVKVVQDDLAHPVLVLQGIDGVFDVTQTVSGARARIRFNKTYTSTSYCDVLLEVKEGRYRVTLTDFYFVSNGSKIRYGHPILLCGKKCLIRTMETQCQQQRIVMELVIQHCSNQKVDDSW